MGALGDSFYEYLLKSWLMTSKDDTDARDMYYEAITVSERMQGCEIWDGQLFDSCNIQMGSDETFSNLRQHCCKPECFYQEPKVNFFNNHM